MTLPTIIRIFFAIDLSEKMKRDLSEFMLALKKKAKTNAIRWTKPENLHITLQFLAQVQSQHIPQMVDNVRLQVANMPSISHLQLSSIQLFPSPFHPRVIVLDVLPKKELAQLAALVGEGVLTTNYEIDTRPFRAHLTLGRIKHMNDTNLQFLSNVIVPNFESIPLEEIVLFRSEPQPDGSRYTAIERIELSHTDYKIKSCDQHSS